MQEVSKRREKISPLRRQDEPSSATRSRSGTPCSAISTSSVSSSQPQSRPRSPSTGSVVSTTASAESKRRPLHHTPGSGGPLPRKRIGGAQPPEEDVKSAKVAKTDASNDTKKDSDVDSTKDDQGSLSGRSKLARGVKKVSPTKAVVPEGENKPQPQPQPKKRGPKPKSLALEAPAPEKKLGRPGRKRKGELEGKDVPAAEKVSPLKAFREQKSPKQDVPGEKGQSRLGEKDVYEFQDADDFMDKPPVMDMKFNAGQRRWGSGGSTGGGNSEKKKASLSPSPSLEKTTVAVTLASSTAPVTAPSPSPGLTSPVLSTPVKQLASPGSARLGMQTPRTPAQQTSASGSSTTEVSPMMPMDLTKPAAPDLIRYGLDFFFGVLLVVVPKIGSFEVLLMLSLAVPLVLASLHLDPM